MHNATLSDIYLYNTHCMYVTIFKIYQVLATRLTEYLMIIHGPHY